MNIDGGGIFSFLPIAKDGHDVNFEVYFGTPTNSFSFEKGDEAFGLPFDSATGTELQGKVKKSPLRRIIHFRSNSGGEKRIC